jgi:hypothetical protein
MRELALSLFFCYDTVVITINTMPPQIKGINLGYIQDKFPNFDTDYNKSWRAIIKKRLATLAAAHSTSSKLTGIKQECSQYFPYLNEQELGVIQDRISGAFRKNLGHPDWNPWRSQLPKIFEGSELDEQTMLTIFETSAETDEPISISKVPKTQTFTVIVSSDNGEQVFRWTGVPKDLAMTSISELTKALA